LQHTEQNTAIVAAQISNTQKINSVEGFVFSLACIIAQISHIYSGKTVFLSHVCLVHIYRTEYIDNLGRLLPVKVWGS
jgi:hypothetical protein